MRLMKLMAGFCVFIGAMIGGLGVPLELRAAGADAAGGGNLSGDWTTFGNGPAHTGYFPGKLGDARFSLRWSTNLGASLQQVAVGGHRVFAASYRTNSVLDAVSEYSGQILWRRDFNPYHPIGAPTYDSNSVYVQLGNDSQLCSIEAGTGTVNWEVRDGGPGACWLAPVVANGGIWVYEFDCALCGFDQLDGARRFTNSRWGEIPSYYAGKLYTDSDVFREYDPITGKLLWSVNPRDNTYSFATTTLVIDAGIACYVRQGILCGLDLANRRLSMLVKTNFSGYPAIANGAVYAISNSIVAAYSTNGGYLGSYVAGSTLQNQPIVTDDALIVASGSATYVFDLGTFELKQTIPKGGYISLANGVLYIACSSGDLYAYSAGTDVALVVGTSIEGVGSPFPFTYGTNFVGSGSMISPRADFVVATNGVRYVATGWSGTGSVPATGSGDSVAFVITNDSSITWIRKQQFYLNSGTISNGTVDVASGWFDAGSELTLHASPAEHFHFGGWEGDVSGTDVVITVTMDNPRRVVARFEPDVVTNAVPVWWLLQYGLPASDAGALADSDGDGVSNWQEHQRGSNPVVAEYAPRFASSLVDQTAHCGSNVIFIAEVEGTLPLNYQWQFGGTNIPGATNASLTLTNVQVASAGLYRLLVTNRFGQVSSTVSLAVSNDLAWALNTVSLTNESLVFTTGSEAPWFAETLESHDGMAAAQNGRISSTVQESWMSTTVTGPALLGFWWKLPALDGYDALVLLDGGVFLICKGVPDWEQEWVRIPPGLHEVTWKYQPSDLRQGSVWVDEVSIWRGVMEGPSIVSQPRGGRVGNGARMSLSVKATGTPPLFYQWMNDGTPVEGATNAVLTFGSVDASCAGHYTVCVSNPIDRVESVPVMVAVTNAMTAALGYVGASWVSGEDPWFAQKRIARDHSGAAQSGAIWDNGASVMGNGVYGPGTISFWWKVSSEQGYDTLQFLVDDNCLAEISGDVGWQRRSFYIASSGYCSVQWRYAKDGDSSWGQDCGWVDSVEFTPDTPPVITLDPASQPVLLGSTVTLKAAARGSAPLSYTWYFNGYPIYGANSEVLKISSFLEKDAGDYCVQVDNNAGSVTSKTAVLNLWSGEEGIVAVSGATVAIDGPATGSLPAGRHQWYLRDEPMSNDSRIHGATARRLVMEKVEVEDSGIYVDDSRLTTSLNVLAPSSVVAWGSDPVFETKVPSELSNVVAVAAGATHNLALSEDGTVIGWGENDSGQLDFPGELHDVSAISAGAGYSLLLRSNGTVAIYGEVNCGGFVVSEGLSNVTAIVAGSHYIMALQTNGTVVCLGDDAKQDVAQWLTDITAIAAGEDHSLALRKDGTVVAWGGNVWDQNEVPANATQVIAIAAGDWHSLALRKDGTVVAWGQDTLGQCQVPSGLNDVVAIAAGASHSLALRRNGTVVAWGAHYDPELYLYEGSAAPPVGLKGVKAIAAKGNHSLALILAPVITAQPVDVTVAAGGDAQLRVEASGKAPLSYQWRFNNQIVRSATNAVLNLSHVQKRQAGTYTVLIRNSAGSVLSAPAKLTVENGAH